MGTLSSLIHRELLCLPRKRFFWIKRIIFVALVSALFYLSIINNATQADLALIILDNFSFYTLLIFLYMAPMSGAMIIAQEKELRTLEILFLTNLSHSVLVLGKFFSCIFTQSLLFFSCLPALILGIGIGGI